MQTRTLAAVVALALGMGVALAGCYRHRRAGADVDRRSSAPLAESILIPGGTFTRGDINGEPSEYPERAIRIDGFRMDRTEVTNAAYRGCVDAAVCDPAPYLDDEVLGEDDHPVVGVSWFDAERYCAWVGGRLPTESEWEYAARGADLRKWPWPGGFDPKRANTRDPGDGFDKTAPVGSFPAGASPFGVLDLAGNAAEWTADVFDPTWYRTDRTVSNPTGPEEGRERVVRGGSWADGPHRVRVASRQARAATEVDDGTGFRCARARN